MNNIKIPNTFDIAQILKQKYINNDFRTIGNTVQQSRTVEIQGAHFIADKDWIIRKPNYEYANRELEWYKTQSLNVNDIPGKTPKMWKMCASTNSYVNSNYGWCILSDENNNQFEHCLNQLIADPHTREACMIYNRPSMQTEYNKFNMHDFMCTYSVQCFLNETEDHYNLDYQVFMRSNDAVFGFCNDFLWHKYVQETLANALCDALDMPVYSGQIIWNCGSLHVYERHFKYFDNI
jgi:thymidylate synthase